jgi:purine-nucleoside phosphorylase
MKVKDIVIATGACTDSNYGSNFGLNGNISAVPSFKLLKKADEISTKLGFQDRTKFGQILSSDIFYGDQPGLLDWAKIGVLAVEMEAYGLYLNAARAGKHGLTICSVSNNIVTSEELTAEERTKNVNDMILLALEIAADLD